MLTRQQIRELTVNMELSPYGRQLVDLVEGDRDDDEWPKEVDEMLNGLISQFPSPEKAYKWLKKTFNIGNAEYEAAQGRHIFEQIKAHGPGIFTRDHLSIIKAMLIDWLAETKREKGDCEPELLYLTNLLRMRIHKQRNRPRIFSS